ncbi:MFS transporter [Raineyella sp. LH-20]|uniref:MFS transporter n=1 Tax=Raineyella sp. LH-20 TaxID=3081204 RepID=UPI002955DAF0|nr:MFS transporter [Raineyella sp. LH-20]WOP19122.1 MFS transporter [Raineyella sp. LH-20]
MPRPSTDPAHDEPLSVTYPDQRAEAAGRARNGDLAVFGVNGFMFATWMSRVPDVKQALGLTPGQLGLLLLAVSAGALCGLPIAGRLAQRFGAVRTVRLGTLTALPGMLLAAVGVTLGAPIPVVMVGLYLLGLGNGVWDVAQNLEGSVIERSLRRAIMPWFHAAFSAGTVLAALVGALLVRLEVPLLVHVVAMAVVCLAGVWWGTVRFLAPAASTRTAGSTRTAASTPPTAAAITGPPGAAEADRPADAASRAGSPHADPAPPVRSAWTEPRTLLVGVMVLAAAFTEGTANDWLAVAFVDGHRVSKALGVVALAVFLTFMTAGRILGTRMLDHYGRQPVLRVLFGSAIVGCLLVVFGPPPLAYLGAAVWGIGASLGFPVGMSAAADDPARAAARLSVVSTIGYGAFLAGPPLLGFLGDHVGVLHALLVVGVVSALAVLVVPAARPLEVPPLRSGPASTGPDGR